MQCHSRYSICATLPSTSSSTSSLVSLRHRRKLGDGLDRIAAALDFKRQPCTWRLALHYFDDILEPSDRKTRGFADYVAVADPRFIRDARLLHLKHASATVFRQFKADAKTLPRRVLPLER